jgi:RNA ligase
MGTTIGKHPKFQTTGVDWLDNPPDRNPMSVSLWDLFDKELFQQMREEGYIRIGMLDGCVLAIANYTEKAQYEQKWNPVTLQCRGLIFDVFTHNVVARPFPKFFNWDDSSQPYPPRSECVLMPKMDGSLGVLYYHDDGYKIATRGSFVSDQAIHATQRLREIAAEWEPVFHVDMTYLFEIIYPENRIVVDYGGQDTLVLLDVIDNFTGTSRFDLFDDLMWPDKVERKHALFSDDLIHDIPQGEEGFVLYWPYQNLRVKMKSAEYLGLHKLIFGLNARIVWERLGAGESWQQICDGLPDEFHPWVKGIAEDLSEQAARIATEAAKQYQRCLQRMRPEYYDGVPLTDATKQDRKAFAEVAKGEPLRGLLFMLYDGKDIWNAIWNSLRPSGSDGIRVLSEDVS